MRILQKNDTIPKKGEIVLRVILFLLLFVSFLFSFDGQKIDRYKSSISEYYYHFLDKSTRFLYKKDHSNYEYIKKHNTLRLYIDNTIDDDGHRKSSLSIRANLKLPKISKNLYLMVDKESDTSASAYENKSEVKKQKQTSRVGLKYYFLKSPHTDIFAKLGGRVRLDGSGFYLQTGIHKYKKYHDINIYGYIHQFFYIKDSFVEHEFGVDFSKDLSEKFTLALNNDISIDDNKDTYLTNTLLLNQRYSKKVQLSYWTTLTTSYKDSSFETQSVSINFKYRKWLKKWVFVDVIPSVIKNLQGEKRTDKYLQINFGFIF